MLCTLKTGVRVPDGWTMFFFRTFVCVWEKKIFRTFVCPLRLCRFSCHIGKFSSAVSIFFCRWLTLVICKLKSTIVFILRVAFSFFRFLRPKCFFFGLEQSNMSLKPETCKTSFLTPEVRLAQIEE